MGDFFKLLKTISTGGFLSGYRTYLLGFGLAFQAFYSWAVEGDSTAAEFMAELPEILGGAGLMSARAAIDKLLAQIGALRSALGDLPEPKPEGWNAAGSSRTHRSFSIALFAVVFLPLLLTACGGTPEVRWAQAQKAYNDGVAGAARYRAPCVEFGPEHPLCLINDEVYGIIEPIRERLDSLLREADAAIQAGNEVGFDIYMNEVDKLLETFLLYTVDNLPRTSALPTELRDLKDAITAFHRLKENPHHEAQGSHATGLHLLGLASVSIGPLRAGADRPCGAPRPVPRTATAALGRAGPEQRAVGLPGS